MKEVNYRLQKLKQSLGVIQQQEGNLPIGSIERIILHNQNTVTTLCYDLLEEDFKLEDENKELKAKLAMSPKAAIIEELQSIYNKISNMIPFDMGQTEGELSPLVRAEECLKIITERIEELKKGE